MRDLRAMLVAHQRLECLAETQRLEYHTVTDNLWLYLDQRLDDLTFRVVIWDVA